jgi:hypothetical protein
MVDLGGYVIILVETKDKKIKLYGKSVLSFDKNEVSAVTDCTATGYFLDS